jgi:hypothetical protein
MPVETLTQNQKNYILMLLMGGELPENEIRMFLARSAWPIDAIDAGVAYSKDEGLKRTLSEARGDVVVTDTTQNQPQLKDASPDITKSIDPYRETTQTASQDFSTAVTSSPQTAMSTPSGLDGIKQPFKNSSESQNINANPLIMTMPPVPVAGRGKGVLTAIAWFLFILLILITAAVLGYMYYTGSGVFGDVIYTKLNLNV